MWLTIPREVIDKIEEHVRSSIRPGREIVGSIVLDAEGVAYTYVRQRNWAKGNGSFVTHWEDFPSLYGNETSILVHSHPYGVPTPSSHDVKGASKKWRGVPYGIIHPVHGLSLFILHEDGVGWHEFLDWGVDEPYESATVAA